MRRVAPVLAALALALTVAGCTSTVAGTPSAAPGVAASIAAEASAMASATANRRVCVDFDARGGALYSVFVVPMMSGASGRRSVDVDIAQFTRATATLGTLSDGMPREASGDIRDEAERVSASAQALGIYDHTEGTALLTSFVGLSVACQQAGQKPSWFDAQALASS